MFTNIYIYFTHAYLVIIASYKNIAHNRYGHYIGFIASG